MSEQQEVKVGDLVEWPDAFGAERLTIIAVGNGGQHCSCRNHVRWRHADGTEDGICRQGFKGRVSRTPSPETKHPERKPGQRWRWSETDEVLTLVRPRTDEGGGWWHRGDGMSSDQYLREKNWAAGELTLLSDAPSESAPACKAPVVGEIRRGVIPGLHRYGQVTLCWTGRDPQIAVWGDLPDGMYSREWNCSPDEFLAMELVAMPANVPRSAPAVDRSGCKAWCGIPDCSTTARHELYRTWNRDFDAILGRGAYSLPDAKLDTGPRWCSPACRDARVPPLSAQGEDHICGNGCAVCDPPGSKPALAAEPAKAVWLCTPCLTHGPKMVFRHDLSKDGETCVNAPPVEVARKCCRTGLHGGDVDHREWRDGGGCHVAPLCVSHWLDMEPVGGDSDTLHNSRVPALIDRRLRRDPGVEDACWEDI